MADKASRHSEESRLEGSYDEQIEQLLLQPYWIVDILPEQVPQDADGQYFAVEKYFLQPVRLAKLRERYAELLLRLNCYMDMTVSFDGGETWERDPAPEEFVSWLVELPSNSFLRVMFPSQSSMADLDATDTYMTVYAPSPQLLDLIHKIAQVEGLFMWKPKEQ